MMLLFAFLSGFGIPDVGKIGTQTGGARVFEQAGARWSLWQRKRSDGKTEGVKKLHGTWNMYVV